MWQGEYECVLDRHRISDLREIQKRQGPAVVTLPLGMIVEYMYSSMRRGQAETRLLPLLTSALGMS